MTGEKRKKRTEDREKKLKCDTIVAQAPPGVRDQYIKSLHPLLIVLKSSHINHILICQAAVALWPNMFWVLHSCASGSSPNLNTWNAQLGCQAWSLPSTRSLCLPVCPVADNVLLSEDGRDTFLCDFGHAEKLDKLGQSLSGSRGEE